MGDDDRLFLEARATAQQVGALRRALRRWLTDVLEDDPDAVDNLTLAASEALENAVDHAFAGASEVGTMTVAACRDAAGPAPRVVIEVRDDGRWQEPTADPGHRGRGLQLIAGLTGSHDVRTGEEGTAVTLSHPA